MTKLLLKGGEFYVNDKLTKNDILIKGQKIVEIAKDIKDSEAKVIDCTNLIIAPAFADPHVHLREPGFAHKETIKSGTKAAAAGGYTTIFAMPNILPTPSNLQDLNVELGIIKRDACIEVLPIASITKGQSGEGELSSFEQLKNEVVGFSDDGVGIKQAKLMLDALKCAKAVNKPIISHAEDIGLVDGGCINKGAKSRSLNVLGIDNVSESSVVARDLELALSVSARYHLCHISTKESLEVVKFYKKRGANVTVEVCPHHLFLTEDDIPNDILESGIGNYKMNPPLRSQSDRASLLKGLINGDIDMIATDHAPHTNEEKNKGLVSAPFGIVGLETAFSLCYTNLVKTNLMGLNKLLELMSKNVYKAFCLKDNEIVVGNYANLCLIDLNVLHKIDKNKFLSMGRNTPFDGKQVYSKVISTIYRGEVVYGK